MLRIHLPTRLRNHPRYVVIATKPYRSFKSLSCDPTTAHSLRCLVIEKSLVRKEDSIFAFRKPKIANCNMATKFCAKSNATINAGLNHPNTVTHLRSSCLKLGPNISNRCRAASKETSSYFRTSLESIMKSYACSRHRSFVAYGLGSADVNQVETHLYFKQHIQLTFSDEVCSCRFVCIGITGGTRPVHPETPTALRTPLLCPVSRSFAPGNLRENFVS